MKFANIERVGKLPNTGYGRKNTFFTPGDYIQLLAIDNLYQEMGVARDVVCLDTADIADYKGEQLIVPVNLMWGGEPWYDRDYNFKFSKDITPIFLGLSLKESTFRFTDKNIAYLREYSPIGCRDYYTFQRVSQHGIPAYIAGCLTMTLPRRKIGEHDPKKVFLVDIPNSLKKYIPAAILEASEVVHHWFELSEEQFKDIHFSKKASRELFDRYQKEAALIITYRQHCAVPCLAMGIPVVLARPYLAYPCDWIEQFTHVYTEEDYQNITWDVKPIDVEAYKEIAKNVAIKRMKGICTQADISKLHEYHKRGYSSDYQPKEMTINHFINEVGSRFHKEDRFDYAIWGVSDVAEKIYEYLTLHYPNARMVKVIDSFSEKVFHGVVSEKPEVLTKSDPYITIVATFVCIESGAEPLFAALGKDPSQYIYAVDTPF